MTFTENDLDVILETSFCNFEILFMKYLQYENREENRNEMF